MKGNTEAKWINTEIEMAMISTGTLPLIGKAAWEKTRTEPMYHKYCNKLDIYMQNPK